MKYYNTKWKSTMTKTKLQVNESYVGETLELKIARIMNNKEPITDGAPLIYGERKDGVQPAYNIRTDRFELALDATDSITAGHLAKRDQRIGEKTYDTMTPEQQKTFNEKYPGNKHNKNIGGAEPTQGTGKQ